MSDLSKFINLLIEFQQKLEGHLNKKYKSFIRSVLNLESLEKSLRRRSEDIKLTNQIIVFKLGLEAKSPKAVQISMIYLLKLFQLKFIDINQPNLCQEYVIEQTGVKHNPGTEIKTEIRHQLLNLIRKNLIYKSNDIHTHTLKLLQFLISEPCLPILLDLTQIHPHDLSTTVLINYFAFRSFVYEEICCYKQAELQSFSFLTLKSQRIEKQIKNALAQHLALKLLIGRYMTQYISIIDKSGGKYGSCVMCGNPAQHYCKITKASLCSMDCKKEHIQIAQRQYKNYFQGLGLWESLYNSFEELMIFLERQDSPLVFGVLTSILQKPHLFMLVSQPFRKLIGKHAPLIFNRILSIKSQACLQNIYAFVVSLAKYWLCETISLVEYFFKEYILKVLDDKKPQPKYLTLVFKSLGKLFQHGKVFIQLYINYDCQVNRQNIIEKTLFQIARIVQDRFVHGGPLNKQDRMTAKNHCLSLLVILSLGLDQYRRSQLKQIFTGDLIVLKQRKMSLQQFVIRFNQHWTTGLKTLFNLNLVGLDSNEEIVDIILNIRGLNKSHTQDLLGCEKGKQLLKVFVGKLKQRKRSYFLLVLLDLFHYIPLKQSIVLKIFLRQFLGEQGQQQYIKRQKQTNNWIQFLSKPFNREELLNVLPPQQKNLSPPEVQQLMMFAAQIRLPVSVGNSKTYFTYCSSRSYLDVLTSQLTLLQIPISYMLQTDYEIDRVITLVQELVQICPHSNWLSLLVKNTSIAKYPGPQFDQNRLIIVKGILRIVENHAAFIQDWSAIVTWLSFLRQALLRSDIKLLEHSLILLDAVNTNTIQHCLMQASSKAVSSFPKLLLAVLMVAKEDLHKQSLFIIQKFFQMVQLNGRKFVKILEEFMPYLLNFIQQLQKISVDHIISITDMIKQMLAKLLKLPKEGPMMQVWVQNQHIFFVIFQKIASFNSKQLSQFVINCANMTILHHFELTYQSWKVIFAIMKQKFAQHRPQIYSLLQKIIYQRLHTCQQFYREAIQLQLQLVHPQEIKISNQSLNLVNNTLEILKRPQIAVHLRNKNQEDSSRLKQLLLQVLQSLIKKIDFNCHQQVIILYFTLLNYQVQEASLLTPVDIEKTLNSFMDRIQAVAAYKMPIAQKAIHVGLKWSASQLYKPYVKLLSSFIIEKYYTLSFSATKCLKIYIQMMNPKTQSQWQHIQHSLLQILQDSRLSLFLDLDMPNPFSINYGADHVNLDDKILRTDVGLLANKMLIQKSIIEMLPNHSTCIPILQLLHSDIVKFNDNLYLRCLLWRRGLGKGNQSHPPHLLQLQETISGKLVTNYHQTKSDKIFQMAVSVFGRYCQASTMRAKVVQSQQKWRSNLAESRGRSIQGQSQQSQNVGQQQTSYQPQGFNMLLQYLRLRMNPLLKIINFFLPKLKVICKQKNQRKEMVLKMVECCKYVETRTSFLKTIRELSKIDI